MIIGLVTKGYNVKCIGTLCEMHLQRRNTVFFIVIIIIEAHRWPSVRSNSFENKWVSRLILNVVSASWVDVRRLGGPECVRREQSSNEYWERGMSPKEKVVWRENMSGIKTPGLYTCKQGSKLPLAWDYWINRRTTISTRFDSPVSLLNRLTKTFKVG